jgi:hypothetical protein
MRSLFEKKPWILILAFLALGALTVLSVSLRSVSFNDVQPIGRAEADPFPLLIQDIFESFHGVSVQSQIFFWIVLAVLIVLIGILLSPEVRKKMIRLLIQVAFFFWVLQFLVNRLPQITAAMDLNVNVAGAGGQAENLPNIPPPVFTPPREIPWLSLLVGMLIILITVFLMWKLYRIWQEMNPGRANSMQSIARIARATLRDLSSGRESTDVILNCYFRMSDVVSDKKNLRRDTSMTPAEFALRLEQSGLPGDAVQRLTRLFESVRYGERRAGPTETNEAVACLTTILQYCGEPV